MTTRIRSSATATIAQLLLIADSAWARHTEHTCAHPYKTGRVINARSAQVVSNYLNGRGMALAQAEDFNGYPGPPHGLENGKSSVSVARCLID